MSKRFALYARVSTEGQKDDGHSLEQQRTDAQGAINREGGELVKVYSTAESAMGKEVRPAWEQMLRDAAARKFDALLITDDSREARNPIDVERLRDVFLKHRIELYMGGRWVDLRSSAVRIGRLVKAVSSQDETNSRLDTSARVRIEQAAMGFATSGGFPFGRSVGLRLEGTSKVWETNANKEAVWHFDPEAKRYVATAAKLYLTGLSWERVAEQVVWPADKPTSPTSMRANTVRRRVMESGGVWEQRFLLRGNLVERFDAIKNRKRVRFEGDEAIVSTPVPALLDETTLARVRVKSENRYFARAQGKTNALSRILRCGNCGSSLNIRHHKTDGSIRVSHQPKMLAGCSSSFLRYEPVELSVLAWLSDTLKDTKQVEAAVRQALEAQVPDAEELRQELADLRRERKKAENSRDAGVANMFAMKVDRKVAAAMGKTLASLNATIERCTEREAVIEHRLQEAQVQPEHEAAIRVTLSKFRRGFSLVQSTLAQQREAMSVLFGPGTLRNRPTNAKQGSPEMGVFLRWVQDPTTGERYIQWRALGQFFFLDGAVSWDERNVFGDAKQHTWDPTAEQLAGVAGTLKPPPPYASQHMGTRARSSSAGSN